MKYITFTNKATIDITLNLIKTIEKFNLDYIVYSIDEYTHEMLSSIGKNSILHDKLFDNNYYQYATTTFNDICKEKIKIISNTLSNYDDDIFYLDSDIILKRDPSVLMDKTEYDLLFQDPGDGYTHLNAGCIFIRNNESTVNFFNELYDNINPNDGDDQQHLNTFIHESNVNYSKLHRSLFPNGNTYFIKNDKNPDMYLLHNNCIVGNDNKIERFKKNNMWYI